MQDLICKVGTIASIMNDWRMEIYRHCESKSQFEELYNVVMECLSDSRIRKNPAVPKAKAIFTDLYSKKKYEVFIRTMMTYMTGDKAD